MMIDEPGYINGVPMVWEMSRSALLVERHRLENGVEESDDGIGTVIQTFRIFCDGSAHEVLERARAVMKIVNGKGLDKSWPTEEQWPDLLPAWFVSSSATNKRIGRLDIPAGKRWTTREHITKTWRLSSWTYWMDPELREWLWFRPVLEGDDAIVFTVDQIGDPAAGTPPGFLWLFRASGAVDYEETK